MKISQVPFENTTGWRLENQFVSAVILPSHGGKVASFVHRETEFELLFQNPKKAYSQGCCGYRYPRSQMVATFHYDETQLPYLGFWCTAGWFRGDVNCALEPSNGYYDSVATAQSRRACPILEPGAAMDFSLELALKKAT